MAETRPDTPDASEGANEVVLKDLHQAEVHYRQQLDQWVAQEAELRDLRLQLATARDESRAQAIERDGERRRFESEIARQARRAEEADQQVVHHKERADQQVKDAERQVTRQKERADQQAEEAKQQARHQRERADQLAEIVRDIHRALFAGDIYQLILRACLNITHSTRGLYITAREGHETLRVRAAIDVDGYEESPPSAFLKALVRKVLDEGTSMVCNRDGDVEGLPKPERKDECFKNFICVPVVLQANLHGIIIAADREAGDYEDEDTEALLSVGNQAAVAVENVRLRRELENAYLSTVSVMADAMEAKDPYTQGHADHVSRYANLTAQRLQLSDEDRSVVCYAALLHDIGKIGVSDGILNKPGELLPEEREVVRSHVRIGYDLIRNVHSLETVADVVLYHHEWYDGSGYPDGLKGDEIPIAARIVGVVDAYSAMVTERSYKPAHSEQWARKELQRCAGTQFDPHVVKAFLAVMDRAQKQNFDPDEDNWCGVLPGFSRIREYRKNVD